MLPETLTRTWLIKQRREQQEVHTDPERDVTLTDRRVTRQEAQRPSVEKKLEPKHNAELNERQLHVEAPAHDRDHDELTEHRAKPEPQKPGKIDPKRSVV